MKEMQAVPFATAARRHRDQRLRRFAEKIAAALAIAAFVYAGLFLIGHFNEAMELAAQSRSAPMSDVYYPSCAAARAAGAAPITMGRPGYRPELDADGDGIACEPYWNRNRSG
jgi:micrococcal nuclease